MNRTIATLSSIFVLAIVAFASNAQAQQNSNQLSKQQLVTLIASAKTPAEHTRIAEYYGAQAQADLALSQEHAQMADQFRKNSVTSSSKFATGTVNHCAYLAVSYKQSAAKMQKLEQEHEVMASEAQMAATAPNLGPGSVGSGAGVGMAWKRAERRRSLIPASACDARRPAM